MRKIYFTLTVLILLFFLTSNQSLQAETKPEKVVFVRASNKDGTLIDRPEQDSYPTWLQKLLGKNTRYSI